MSEINVNLLFVVVMMFSHRRLYALQRNTVHTHMKHTYIVLLIIKSASDFGCCLQLGFLVLSSLQSLLFKDRCFFFCLDHYFMVLIILACPLHLNLNLASPKTFFLNFMTSLSDVIPCCYPSRNMTTYMTEMYM